MCDNYNDVLVIFYSSTKIHWTVDSQYEFLTCLNAHLYFETVTQEELNSLHLLRDTFFKIGPKDVTKRRPFRHAPHKEGTCWPTLGVRLGQRLSCQYLQDSHNKHLQNKSVYRPCEHCPNHASFLSIYFSSWLLIEVQGLGQTKCQQMTAFVCEYRGLSKNMQRYALHWQTISYIPCWASATASANVNHVLDKTQRWGGTRETEPHDDNREDEDDVDDDDDGIMMTW